MKLVNIYVMYNILHTLIINKNIMYMLSPMSFYIISLSP